MLSNLGLISVVISALSSFLIIYYSYFDIKIIGNHISKKIIFFSNLQITFTFLSFFTLLFAFLISDFSLINVYENSHTTKPIFYKISGTWGNHEGSLLLWILILVLFSFLFFNMNSNLDKKFRLLTLIFQNLLIFAFFAFLLFISNPFNTVYPKPLEGLGLNPILQDPALAIHPPLLYLGFVGSSIYFSTALASLICKLQGIYFAKTIKPWVLISWFFQTIGILAGSIWAYYELGWGGFWFWDAVENASLIPWFLMTALMHSILVMERKNELYVWTVILSILTFTMSVTGTFLVRSGILNSVHTFANDPSRGLFILMFLTFMILSSLFIFFKYSPGPKKILGFLGKEYFILANNWFMIFFLLIVLIGTLYPIFLEVISGEKISIGPPYYNIVIAPFIIPFLLLMSIGPQMKWFKSSTNKLKINLFISIILVSIGTAIFLIINEIPIILILIIISSVFLIVQTSIDFLKSLKTKLFDLPRIISHFGFGLLIFFISINHIFSNEYDFNLKVGETKKFEKYIVKFEDLKILTQKNYKTLTGYFEVSDIKNNKIENLQPEIRFYNQPSTITYEASIKTKISGDTYLTMSNLNNSEFYNIKFQKKPFMGMIWFSVILIALGGLTRLFKIKVL